MAAVMIGVDPRKGSHTAVAIGAAEELLGELRVRASAGQSERLLAWAAAWPQRTWAIEGAAGLGHLLAQQLLAAGERVLDVQPKLGARVRLLAAGAVNKNDPNDARSVAVAALRSPAQRQVEPDDHAAVLKMWAKRHRDLGRARTQVVRRLHAVRGELVAGGVSGTRGVVPLAAALSIPLTTTSGALLPQRDLVLVLAAATIVISLIVQGFTLEPLARLAGFGPAATADPRHEETIARLHMAEAGLARLDELAEAGAAPDAVIDRLRATLQARIGTTRARLDQDPGPEPGALTERELRGDLITVEGAELSRLYDGGTINAATRRRLQRNLDLETARLTEGHQ